MCVFILPPTRVCVGVCVGLYHITRFSKREKQNTVTYSSWSSQGKWTKTKSMSNKKQKTMADGIGQCLSSNSTTVEILLGQLFLLGQLDHLMFTIKMTLKMKNDNQKWNDIICTCNPPPPSGTRNCPGGCVRINDHRSTSLLVSKWYVSGSFWNLYNTVVCTVAYTTSRFWCHQGSMWLHVITYSVRLL